MLQNIYIKNNYDYIMSISFYCLIAYTHNNFSTGQNDQTMEPKIGLNQIEYGHEFWLDQSNQ